MRHKSELRDRGRFGVARADTREATAENCPLGTEMLWHFLRGVPVPYFPMLTMYTHILFVGLSIVLMSNSWFLIRELLCASHFTYMISYPHYNSVR